MAEGHRVIVRAGSGLATSDPNLNLLSAALAQHAALSARVRLPESVAAGRSCRAILKSLTVTSADGNDWEFWFWRNARFQQSGHPDQEDFAGLWAFSTSGGDGKRIGATGLYYYYIDGLAILLEDEDAGANPSAGGFLNVSLVNRSAGAKTADAWFRVDFLLEPTYV